MFSLPWRRVRTECKCRRPIGQEVDPEALGRRQGKHDGCSAESRSGGVARTTRLASGYLSGAGLAGGLRIPRMPAFPIPMPRQLC
jgi:hypothetical protein